MPSKPVKVMVIVPERTFTRDDGSTDTEKGYWVFGKFFPNGSSTDVLEDDPDGEPLPMYNFETQKQEIVRRPGYTVAQKLRQLEDAKGGKEIVLQDGNKTRKVRTPAMLEYVVLDEKPQASASK